MSRTPRRLWTAALAGSLAAAVGVPASAQLGGLVPGGLGSPLEAPLPAAGPLVGDALGAVRGAERALPDPRAVRLPRLRALVRAHPDLLDFDDHGAAVVRGEVLALSPSAAALALAGRAGFEAVRTERLDELGLSLVVLKAPAGWSSVKAVRRLRKLDPSGDYDFNHLYDESGASGAPGAPAPVSGGAAASAAGARIGLVDGGADLSHPALRGLRIDQRSFAPGGPKVSAHGTATASLLAGRDGAFHGAAPGASLYLADVYGSTPRGGSADEVVGALGWMAQARAPVVSISLVGPPNRVLGAAVQALIARGTIVVAAVGNDGPAAPPLYPASYPGVVAVTAVDARGRLLPEAGRALHVDFAAPGAQMVAAAPGGGYQAVRGTSYAAPIVAGLLAGLDRGGSGAAARAVDSLARRAVDLGARGPDPAFGRGLVGQDLRIAPAALEAQEKSRPAG